MGSLQPDESVCITRTSLFLRLEGLCPQALLAHGIVQPLDVDLQRLPVAAARAATGQPPRGLILLLGLLQLAHEVEAGAEVHARRGVLRPQRHSSTVELLGAFVIACLPESLRVVVVRTAESWLIHSIAAGRDDLFLSHDSSFYLKTENCFIHDSLLLEELTVIPKGHSFLSLALKSMEI